MHGREVAAATAARVVTGDFLSIVSDGRGAETSPLVTGYIYSWYLVRMLGVLGYIVQRIQLRRTSSKKNNTGPPGWVSYLRTAVFFSNINFSVTATP